MLFELIQKWNTKIFMDKIYNRYYKKRLLLSFHAVGSPHKNVITIPFIIDIRIRRNRN